MLQEQKIVDKIEIVDDTIYVRECIVILKDGKKIASSYNRFIVTAEQDLTNLDLKVKTIAEAFFSQKA